MHQNRCAFRKVSKRREVDPPVPDLHNLPLALALVLLTRTLALCQLLDLGVVAGEVSRTPAGEASVG